MENKKVLYAAFDVVPGAKGASVHILHFLKGLVNAGYEVTFISAGDGILPEEEILNGVHFHRTKFHPNDHFLARASAFNDRVKWCIEQGAPYDYVHFRAIWGGFQTVMLKKQNRYKTIFEVNGLPSVELKYHYPQIGGGEFLEKIREQELITLQLSDAIICPSQVTRAYLISMGAAAERITVIPNGADLEVFRPEPFPSEDDHTPTLLYIGTLADWQGLDILLDAMPVILEEQQVKLRIVGRGRSRQRKKLEKTIQKKGLIESISLEEAVPHSAVPGLIQNADICLAPLGYNDRNVTQGCCPIKIIEYMACGRPLVAANLPVVRELVREDMDAKLFAPDDPNDLASKVIQLLRDWSSAKEMAANAAVRARDHFSWHTARHKLIEVYKSLD